MAQFRLSMTAASRSAGRNVVAMAAYRSGDRLDDRHRGETQDYQHRKGVVYSEILLPGNAPEWAADRGQLWSRVEDAEKRDDAVLAREVQLSLPHELTDAQRIELTRDFAQYVATEYGLAVDMNIHAPSEQGSDLNHHAHLMLTTRQFDDERESGFAKAKDRRFNAPDMRVQGRGNAVSEMREAWEHIQNLALERYDIRDADGELVQVDRRSYEARGLEIEPTIKLGYAASEMERRGESSDRAQANAEIRERNAIKQERAALAIEIDYDRHEAADIFDSIKRTPLIDQLWRRRQEVDNLNLELAERLDRTERPSDRMNEILLGGPSLDERQQQREIDRLAEAERQREADQQRQWGRSFSR